MNPPSDRNVLLGALLDRLGTAEAHAWLARLDQWLSRDIRGPHQEDTSSSFDRDQLGATAAPYDRRKRDRDDIPLMDSKTA